MVRFSIKKIKGKTPVLNKYQVNGGKAGSRYFKKRIFFSKAEAQDSLDFRRAYAKVSKR